MVATSLPFLPEYPNQLFHDFNYQFDYQFWKTTLAHCITQQQKLASYLI